VPQFESLPNTTVCAATRSGYERSGSGLGMMGAAIAQRLIELVIR